MAQSLTGGLKIITHSLFLWNWEKMLLCHIIVSPKTPRMILLGVDSIIFETRKYALVWETRKRYNYEIKDKL